MFLLEMSIEISLFIVLNIAQTVRKSYWQACEKGLVSYNWASLYYVQKIQVPPHRLCDRLAPDGARWADRILMITVRAHFAALQSLFF